MSEERTDPAEVRLAALPGAAAVVDADRTVVAANERWRERRERGVPGHAPVGAQFPGDDVPALAAAADAVLSGDAEAAQRRLPAAGVTVSLRAYERDGRRRAVVTSGPAGEWPGGASAVLDGAGDAVGVYDAAAGRVHVNEAAASLLGLADRSLPAESPAVERVLARASDGSVEALREAGRVVLEGEADERRVEVELAPATGLPMVLGVRLTALTVDGDRRGVVAVGRDVTEYRSELRELAQLRDARETLTRVTTIVQDLIGALVGETHRADIEAAVAEELSRSELYRFAVVGRYHPAQGDLLELTALGVDEAVARALGPPLLAAHESLLRTGAVQVVDLDGFDLPAPIAGNAVVVPLTYGSAVYGLLCVGLGRAGLTDRELSAFEVLGDVVGFAINAAKHRRLALTDLVTELEFEVEREGVLATLSSALDAAVRVESVVPRDEDSQLQYVDVGDADPEAAAEAARDIAGVEAVRTLPDGPESGDLELAVAGASVPLALGERGGTVESARAEDGVARVTAVVAAEENVRALVEHVRAAVPGAELVGKRDVEGETARERVPDDAVESLTERQRAALETAYRAGYFAHPRGSTAEEVAETLDIASPTLHQHLQAAHRKLLAGVFDDT